MSERASPLPREAFAVFRPITTRWMDNDAYGHVNNVVYYSYFDTSKPLPAQQPTSCVEFR
ncbi:acyl-CoA thioesterase [Microvirga massiliensis]|uniref:acyl-CoA thioesterase n=1 Tax=Microvirga massiliensis TaxID=1033741 RepID=UPI000A94CEC5